MTDRVRLRVKGRFPERFVERALSRGVRFARIERLGPRELRLTASSPDAKAICALAAELGLELTEEGREGWRAAADALRRRVTLLPGLALCVALVALFAGRVWIVDITALDAPLPPEAEAALAVRLSEMGVRPGVSRSSLDAGLISARLLSEFESLSFAGVRLRGARLTVEYKTEDAAPPLYRADEAGSLYAARDAIVVSVRPLAGKALVKPGDVVRAGQRLISGEERTGAEATRAVRALGEVMGRVWFSGRSEAPLTETARERTGRVRYASALMLPGARFPLTEAEDFASQDVETDSLPVGGLFLPIRIERRALYETAERERDVDRDALAQALARQALSAARAGLPEGAVERACWTETTEAEGWLTVEAYVEAAMNIAVLNEPSPRGTAD
ncbi:MAG: sporulation protein YqfD [Clostridia bacterium]|nr:sporulation protein YqfD [Clostridia bacterium]